MPNPTNRTKKTVPLGSGLTYIVEAPATLPSIDDIVAYCTDENQYGETKSGATLTYSMTEHREQDDHGKLVRVITTDEDVKFKTGVFSWCPGMLPKLIRTGRMTTEGKYNVLRIGGLNNDDGKQYLVIFKHIDPKYPPLYIILVGTNTAGLTLVFARDNTTKLEPEFTAEAMDDAGTRLMIVEATAGAEQQATGESEQQTAGAEEDTTT